MQTLLLLIILYKTNWNKEVWFWTFKTMKFTLHVTSINYNVFKLQVNDTTERMRKWGGQDFETQKSADGQLTIENGGVA